MKTVVLVPWRPDKGRRDRLWNATRDWLTTHHPDWPIHTGESPPGPFNRSAAINTAAAGAWDVAVIHDADTLTPPDQLQDAVDTAAVTGRLVAAFTQVVELTGPCTDRILADGFPPTTLEVARVRTADYQAQSSALAITRQLWDQVGGFDDRFIGWGAEDNAFWYACQVCGGNPLRIPGDVYHLWHPTGPHNHKTATYRANYARLELYRHIQTPNDLQALRA